MPKFSFLSKNLVCNLDHYLYDFENFLTLSKTSDCTRSKTLPKNVKNLRRGRRLCPDFHFSEAQARVRQGKARMAKGERP